jgi:hypothetical protein
MPRKSARLGVVHDSVYNHVIETHLFHFKNPSNLTSTKLLKSLLVVPNIEKKSDILTTWCHLIMAPMWSLHSLCGNIVGTERYIASTRWTRRSGPGLGVLCWCI